MAQVRWTLGAASDLERIAEYLSNASDVYASAFVVQVLAATAILEEQPRLGRVVPEFQMAQMRELIVRGYRDFYILDTSGESVRIYAIQHGSRNVGKAIGEQPWERP